jgi:DNA-binding protein H-NS
MTTYRQLKAEIAKLEKQAESTRQLEKASVVAAMKKTIEEFDITAKDLGLTGRTKATTKKGEKVQRPPKYRDPKSGATWSGFGHAPKWLAAAVKRGRKDEFLIGASPSAVAKAPSAAANKPVTKKTTAKKTAPKKPAERKPAKPAAKKAKPAVAKKVEKPAAKKVKKAVPKAAPKKKAAPAKVAAPKAAATTPAP